LPIGSIRANSATKKLTAKSPGSFTVLAQIDLREPPGACRSPPWPPPRSRNPTSAPTAADRAAGRAHVDEARALVAALGDAVSFYKVGLELFASDGMALARELKAPGKQVFLDWKLHDIGTTVQRAAAVLAQSGCDFLTVHGEPQVMAAAVRGRGTLELKILAVTVLTSLDDEDLARWAMPRPPAPWSSGASTRPSPPAATG
jgi:hypothetical protein